MLYEVYLPQLFLIKQFTFCNLGSFLFPRQNFGPGFLQPAELMHPDQQPPEAHYSSRGIYSEEMPSVARPRPVGSTAGTLQLNMHYNSKSFSIFILTLRSLLRYNSSSGIILEMWPFSSLPKKKKKVVTNRD